MASLITAMVLCQSIRHIHMDDGCPLIAKPCQDGTSAYHSQIFDPLQYQFKIIASILIPCKIFPPEYHD